MTEQVAYSTLGMWEIVAIAAIGLVVLGPEKFPEFAKIAMRAVRDVRSYWEDIKRDLTDELRPVKDNLRELSYRDPEEVIDALSRTAQKAQQVLDESVTGEAETGDSPDSGSAGSPYPEEGGGWDTAASGQAPESVPGNEHETAPAQDGTEEQQEETHNGDQVAENSSRQDAPRKPSSPAAALPADGYEDYYEDEYPD